MLALEKMIAAECSSFKIKVAGFSCIYLFLVTSTLFILPSFCFAEKFGVDIKKAALTLQGNSYELSAEMVYQLSERAKEALSNGVPLFWDLKVKVRQHRNYFRDKTVVEKVIRYRIQYHALLKMYRVRNEGTGNVENFSTLSAALDQISILQNFRIMDKTTIDQKNTYYAEMKIIFDREALPLPLRPIAYLNSHWYLSSDWFSWYLTK
jgi:hypothetical protein